MTSEEDQPTNLPFEGEMYGERKTHGIGRLTGDLGDEYLSVTVPREQLEELIGVADLLDWDEVTISLYNGKPILLRNAEADDEPTLAVAPLLNGGDLDD